VTTDSPHSNTIVLDFEQLPTEGAVLANLQNSNPTPGDVVAIRVNGEDVTSAIVIEGDKGSPIALRLGDALAPE